MLNKKYIRIGLSIISYMSTYIESLVGGGWVDTWIVYRWTALQSTTKKTAPPGTLTKDKLLCVDVRINRVGACRKTYLFLHILTNQHVLFRVVGIAAKEGVL